MIDESDEPLRKIIEQELLRSQSELAATPETDTKRIAELKSYIVRCKQILLDLKYVERNRLDG